MKKSSIIKWFLLIALIMLFNALLFNLLTKGTILNPWKQYIWFLMMVLYAKTIQKYRSMRHARPVISCSVIVIFICTLLSIMSGFINNYNYVRMAFSYVSYLYGIPFILMPLIFWKSGGLRKLILCFVALAFVLDIGLIFDHLFGFFKIFRFGVSSDMWIENRSMEYNRATFLFESPTTLAITMLYVHIWAMWAWLKKIEGLLLIFSLASLVLLLPAAVFTGSRQVLYIMGPFLFVGIIASLKFSERRGKIPMVIQSTILAILVFFFSNDILTHSQNSTALTKRLSNIEEENTRKNRWMEGIHQLSPSNFEYWLAGHGIGSCFGQHAGNNEVVHSHFESTILMTFYEGGLMAWFIFFSPIFMGLIFSIKTYPTMYSFFSIYFLLSTLFISAISPNGLHFNSQICLYLNLGFLLLTPAFEYENFSLKASRSSIALKYGSAYRKGVYKGGRWHA